MNTGNDFDSLTQEEQDQLMIAFHKRWKARQLAEQRDKAGERNKTGQKKFQASVVALKVAFVVSSITTVVFLVLAILS